MINPARKPPEQTRVLVVEDEGRLREMLVHAIHEMGFCAAGTRSAEDALRAMESEPHDIALIDLNLPGMGGMDLLELVHKRWPSTRVIILTGYGDLDAARSAIHLDVVDFLAKPASLGEIEVALDRAHRRWMGPAAGAPTPSPRECRITPGAAPTTLQDVERHQILEALDRNNGNRAATAAELGISVRTLYYRLAEFQRQGYLS